MQRRNTDGHVRPRVPFLAAMAMAAMAALGLVLPSDGLLTENERATAQVAERPNIIFILTDDMRKDDLKYMPKTRTLLQTQGMQFQNAFVSLPTCCPSRATIMRGQ